MLFCRTHIAAIIVLLLVQSPAVIAQDRDYGWHNEFYHPESPLPPELQFSQDHASTAMEGALRGQAQLTHAKGNYLLSATQAMICHEQALALTQSNRQRWVAYRIGMREWHKLDRKHRAEELRRANEASRPTKFAVYRLKANELDRTTGSISWPTALQTTELESSRSRLDRLFRFPYGGVTPDTVNEIVICIRSLSRDLQRRYTTIDRDEYRAAQKFLCGLTYEVEVRSTSDEITEPPPMATAQIALVRSK